MLWGLWKIIKGSWASWFFSKSVVGVIHIQGCSQSILETGVSIGHSKNVLKNFMSQKESTIVSEGSIGHMARSKKFRGDFIGIRLFTKKFLELQFLVFFELLLIPETVIIFNQISNCVTHRSVPYKKHITMSSKHEEITLFHDFFCVFILYLIGDILSNKCYQKRGVRKKI